MQGLKKKLTLDSKIDMSNLMNFNLSSGKSENLHFDVLLLLIAYKVHSLHPPPSPPPLFLKVGVKHFGQRADLESGDF